MQTIRFRTFALGLLAGFIGLNSLAAELQPFTAPIEIKAPKEIHWVRNAAGTSEQAVLFGDPSKPGPYVIRIKWLPGNNFSRPHFHNGDRFFTVISGTWWVGSGEKYDPATAVPAPAGSYVLHKAGQIHYDGAKDEETIIQVTGFGPLVTTQVAKP